MRKLAAPLFVSLCLLFASNARAADKLRIEKLDLEKPGYPTVRMFITYVDSDGRVITGRQKEEFHFILDSADQGTSKSVETWDTLNPPANANVVVVAQESSAMNEVFDEVKRGIKNLADSFDPKTKSKMALLGYASDTKRLVEMSAPSEVESATNTMAIDPEGVEVHMLDALRTAIDLLNAAPKGERKLIVLFSDGIDVNMDTKAFQSVGNKAKDGEIVIDTIGYAPFEATRLRNLAQLSRLSFGTERQCKNSGDITTQFAAVADEIKKQYIVTFESSLAPDKKKHMFQAMVDAGGRQGYSNEVEKLVDKVTHPLPDKGGSRWWLWLLIAVGGLGIVGLVAWLLMRDKEAPMEEPAAPAPAPVAAPQPSAAAGPQKTMALDVSGGGKMPAVGWIVATSGKHANQTFKFKPVRTVIGTAADCDIVIEDQFMSSRHCEVRVEPNGSYKLIDLGSTNGIVVNDKKVREHELVDNDQFRLGRTEFKYKSIS